MKSSAIRTDDCWEEGLSASVAVFAVSRSGRPIRACCLQWYRGVAITAVLREACAREGGVLWCARTKEVRWLNMNWVTIYTGGRLILGRKGADCCRTSDTNYLGLSV